MVGPGLATVGVTGLADAVAGSGDKGRAGVGF